MVESKNSFSSLSFLLCLFTNISVCVPLVKKLSQSGARRSPFLPDRQHTGNVKRSLLSQLSVYFSFQRRALYIATVLQSFRNPFWSMCKLITLQYDTLGKGEGRGWGEQLYFSLDASGTVCQLMSHHVP